MSRRITGTSPRDRNIGIRVTAEEQEEIQRRAVDLGMTQTEYLIRAALGTLNVEVEAELDQIRNRLGRLEELAGL